jgi:hypothetical protein
MRTKTLALSAFLGLLGAASAIAQTNVYSINAVGYINVTLYPGYNLITCPLTCSPDNTIATLFPNKGGANQGQYQIGSGRSLNGATISQWVNGPGGPSGHSGYLTSDSADDSQTSGWAQGGTIPVSPGAAIWFFNPVAIGGSNMLATFVGTVPQATNGPLTNTLYNGYNLVGSMVPVSGDLVTNSIAGIGTNATVPVGNLAFGPQSGDAIFVYDPTPNGGGGQGGYVGGTGGNFTVDRHGNGTWTTPDPATVNVTEGFWYLSANATTNNWIENFTINP